MQTSKFTFRWTPFVLFTLRKFYSPHGVYMDNFENTWFKATFLLNSFALSRNYVITSGTLMVTGITDFYRFRTLLLIFWNSSKLFLVNIHLNIFNITGSDMPHYMRPAITGYAKCLKIFITSTLEVKMKTTIAGSNGPRTRRCDQWLLLVFLLRNTSQLAGVKIKEAAFNAFEEVFE